jgi:hypothetical protein
MGLRHLTGTTACLLVLLAAIILSACGEHKEPGVDEPAREGLAIDVGGVDYNVYLTRELNLKIPPDKAYYNGKPAKKGHALYGIFIRTCNEGTEPVTSAKNFTVEDNQGNEFEPIEVDEDNAFAYKPRRLGEGDCIPEDGSVAQLGPTAASMLIFDFPLQNTENRPLELHIEGPYDFAKGKRESKTVELDL